MYLQLMMKDNVMDGAEWLKDSLDRDLQKVLKCN